MAQTINTNVMTMIAQRNLDRSQDMLQVAMERLSSGLRVNSAKDDAAGLAIAERMETQVRGMQVAMRNAADGISLSQTAEGGLNEVGNMLQRMRELAVQSANGTNSEGDRANLQTEYAQLAEEVTRIANTTQFNGNAIIGPEAGEFLFQVGANEGETISVTTADLTADGDIGAALTATVDGADPTNPTAAIPLIDAAIDVVTTERAKYGAIQSRFESTINNLQIGIENQSAARGRIVDADFAVETARMTRAQILQQAGNAMVAQANVAPQSVLQLLG